MQGSDVAFKLRGGLSLMDQLLLIGAASLVLGMRHATDPDHVLAVATIVSRERSLRGAARIGAVWGLGHGFTLAAVGGTVIGFRLVLAPGLELSLQLAAALMLIFLGALTLWRRRAAPARLTSLRPFAVGVVHGLAGSAAASVLVMSAIADVHWGLVYLLVFSVGTLLGMTIMTSVLAAPSLLADRHGSHSPEWLRRAAGAATLAFGCYLAFRIGIVDGLLMSSPNSAP
jgi:ABC-type nickel/cobalt efflux system permease component RcnA